MFVATPHSTIRLLNKIDDSYEPLCMVYVVGDLIVWITAVRCNYLPFLALTSTASTNICRLVSFSRVADISTMCMLQILLLQNELSCRLDHNLGCSLFQDDCIHSLRAAFCNDLWKPSVGTMLPKNRCCRVARVTG